HTQTTELFSLSLHDALPILSYILFVNPADLGASGMNKGALFTATALSAAFTCIVMGVIANYPIASAPTLGLNAFFTYTVCLGMRSEEHTSELKSRFDVVCRL